jgi:hypothetical protein
MLCNLMYDRILYNLKFDSIMAENELKKLLDREKHKTDVKQYFSSQIDALTDMVNYGSWLIPRAYDSSKKKLEDVIIITVLLKQVVTMIDAVEILVSNGAVYPAFLQARAGFEASLYIDWILKEEADKKARYYYISNIRHERLWALRIIEGTTEQQEFTIEVKDLAPYRNFKNSNIQHMAQERLSEIDRILNQDNFKPINDELEMLKKKRKREPYWYQPLLKAISLKRIAKAVERGSEYVYLYEIGSKITHAASYRNHIQFSKGGKFAFEPIRNLREIDTLLRFAMGAVLINTYKSILSKYRHGELQNFAHKYQNYWRQSFLNMPSVEYKSPKDNVYL